MKAKLLLCMMALGALVAAEQLPQSMMPRILDDGFLLMPNINQVAVKSFETTMKNMVPNCDAKRMNKVLAEQLTLHQVDFVLDFDDEIRQKPYEIILKNNDYEIHNRDLGLFQLQKGSNVLSIPEGTYDIIVQYAQLDLTQAYELPLYFMFVIREQVTISQDMELNFAASEAKNHIHFQTLTIDGEPIYTGKWTVDENFNWIQLEQGNTEDVYALNKMSCPEIGLYINISGNMGRTVVGDVYHVDCHEKFFDFFVNDVSERYTFYSHRVALANDAVYSSAYEVQGASGDVTVTNDPAKFTLFEEPFLIPSRPGEDLYRSFSFFSLLEGPFPIPNFNITSTTPLMDGQAIKYYIGASTEDSQVGFVPTLEPSVSIKTVELIDFGNGQIFEQERYVPVMYCMPLVMSGGQLMFANNGTGGRYSMPNPSFDAEPSEELDQWGRDIKQFPDWPSHPVFSYEVSKKKDNLCNNCPLLVSDVYQYEITYTWSDEDGNPISETDRTMNLGGSYLGRYGETPDFTAEATINVNGEPYEGPFYGMEALLNGEVEVNFTNESVPVDDMISSNKAQLHYTAGAEDENPPTMTMLHFKDDQGNVTDRFATAADGRLEFSAGDFNFVITPQTYVAYNRQAPESVEVSYSPYGEDNWNELPVEEVPENYWPVMGWFYTGSLAGVTGQGLNGWFDLKIRLTDAGGNWQEQVLSPAFRIDDHAYSSVASVGSSNAHEVARYNLAGQRVDADATGVVIIKMSDGTARKVVL